LPSEKQNEDNGNEFLNKEAGIVDEDLLSENIDSAMLISEAMFWSEQADEREMATVLEMFKDSPQDQLILMKIRFEQRII
jgi:lipopolysaccharide export LptBFGC system permease protein LptF